MKSLLKKLALSLISICVSLLVVEVGIRLYHYKLNQPQSFQFINDAIPIEITQLNEKKRGYNRDHTSEIFKGRNQSNIQFITIGDSFTNGGNLDYTKSYPYNLYEKLYQNYQVHNYGICESTSRDSIYNIQRFYKDNTSQKKNIFLVLTGATDLFFQDPDTTITNIGRSGLSQKPRLIEKTEQSNSFEIKSIELLKYYYKIHRAAQSDIGIKKHIETSELLKKSFSPEEVQSCLQNKLSIQAKCLSKKILNLKDKDQKRRMAILMASYFREFRYSEDVSAYSDHIKALETYYLNTGHLLEDVDFLDFVATTSFLSLKQSKISSLDIKKVVTNIENKFKDKLSKYSLFQEAKEKLSYWLINSKELRQKRRDNLIKIIEDVQSAKDEVILLTYPLNYKQVNEDIREVARTKQISLIDLEKLFSNYKKTNPKIRLINDGQHCTQAGYKLMATFVGEHLKKTLPNL